MIVATAGHIDAGTPSDSIAADRLTTDRLDTVGELLLPGSMGVLTIATVFAVLIRPRAEQVAGLRRRAVADRRAEVVAAAREKRLVRLNGRVRPLLEVIASGRRLSGDEVAACLLTEAGLRDRIRAPGLDTPDIVDACWDARARGVHVLLLDDRDGARLGGPAEALHPVQSAAVGALTGARTGAQVTVRLLPEGRDLIATITVVDGDDVRRIDFSATDSGANILAQAPEHRPFALVHRLSAMLRDFARQR